MDQNLTTIIDKRIEKTIKALKRNNMNGYHVRTVDDLKALLLEFMPPKTTLAVGGSQTLFETGLIDWLREQPFTFYDRYAPGLTPQEVQLVHRKAFSADAYLASSNAITEQGELYNVDGSGNRVAAITFGPSRVYLIVSPNKIVKDLDAAIARNREIAAPANNVRLSTNTPCTHTGSCNDCRSENRICCSYSIIGHQRDAGRIHVIFLDGQWGY